jgi:hypothetical protein
LSMASRLALKKPVRQEQVVMYELKTNGRGVMGRPRDSVDDILDAGVQ